MEVHVYEVVSELVEDIQFVENWKILYYYLPTRHLDIVSLDHQHKNGSLKIHQVLMEVFSSWISKVGNSATIAVLHDILTSKNFKMLADKLQQKYSMFAVMRISLSRNVDEVPSYSNIIPSSAELDVPYWFEVLQPSTNFVGRIKELEQIDKFCKTTHNKIMLVTGMGGIGKTQLITTFAYQYYNLNKGSVIWLQGNSENSFISSIEIERLTGFCFTNTDNSSHLQSNQWIARAVDFIYRNLKSNPILILIDNLDSENQMVELFMKNLKRLPPINLPKVVVTSRKLNILGYISCTLTVNTFDPSVAKKFVYSALLGDYSFTDKNSIKSLCELLQYFPLALNQAVAFIKMKRKQSVEVAFSVSDYINHYKSQKDLLLGYQLNELESDYALTTLTTWNVTLKSIESQPEIGLLAVHILNILAYLDLKDLELKRLEKILIRLKLLPSNTNVPNLLTAAVELVRSYSMCSIIEKEPTLPVDDPVKLISIHCLLQEVIRLNNIEQGNTDFMKLVIDSNPNCVGKKFTSIYKNAWFDILKIGSFVEHNVHVLYQTCLKLFTFSSTINKIDQVQMIEQYNNKVFSYGKTKFEGDYLLEWRLIEMSIRLLYANENAYCKIGLMIYSDINNLYHGRNDFLKDFVFILDFQCFSELNIFASEIDVQALLDLFYIAIEYSSNSHHLYLLDAILNVLCVRNQDLETQVSTIERSLCRLYYNNELPKRQTLLFLKVIENNKKIMNVDEKEGLNDVQGIFSYSNQLRDELRVCQTISWFENYLWVKHVNLISVVKYALLGSTSFNPSVLFKNIAYYLKECENQKLCAEFCINMLVQRVQKKDVCKMNVYFVAQILAFCISNSNNLAISDFAKYSLVQSASKQYTLVNQLLDVIKYRTEICCKTELDKKINIVMKQPVFNEMSDVENHDNSNKKILSATNLKCKWVTRQPSNEEYIWDKCCIRSKNKELETIENTFNIHSHNNLVIKNNQFAWEDKFIEDIDRRVVFLKMKKSTFLNFENAVLKQLETVNDIADNDIRYETLWCAEKLFHLKFYNVINDETLIELPDDLYSFLEKCFVLTKTQKETSIFLGTVNHIVNTLIESHIFQNTHLRLFLIVLKHSHLNVVLLKLVFKTYHFANLKTNSRTLLTTVLDLLKRNLIKIPQNGYKVIKLLNFYLLTQREVELSRELLSVLDIPDPWFHPGLVPKKEFWLDLSQKTLSLSIADENHIPVDIAVVIFYHMLLSETKVLITSFLRRILMFLKSNNEFIEMINISRNIRRISSRFRISEKTHLIKILEITVRECESLSKSPEFNMLSRLEKPIFVYKNNARTSVSVDSDSSNYRDCSDSSDNYCSDDCLF